MRAHSVLVVALAGLVSTTAAVARDAHAAGGGLRVSGSAAMNGDAPVQRNARFELTAAFSNAAPPTTVRTQRDGRFELAALLASATTACYDDTIFRDAFDGSGL